jgi:hypothetical protein
MTEDRIATANSSPIVMSASRTSFRLPKKLGKSGKVSREKNIALQKAKNSRRGLSRVLQENLRQRPLIPNLARALIRRQPWGGLKGLLECQSQPLDAYYHLG